MTIEVGFPFTIDARGRMWSPSYDQHVRQLVELVLFTSPGERVNQPEFGCGLMQVVFEPLDAPATTATEYLVRSALQRWLGDVITVENLTFSSTDSLFEVDVQYLVKATGQRHIASFQPPSK